MNYTIRQKTAILKSLLLIIHADNIRSIQEQQFLRWFSIQHNEPLDPLMQAAEEMTLEEMKEELAHFSPAHFREVQNLWYICSLSDGIVPEELHVIRELALPSVSPANRDHLTEQDIPYITATYTHMTDDASVRQAPADFLVRYNTQQTHGDLQALEDRFYMNKELLDTLDLYDFDLESFWNLVLFVKDVIEEKCDTAVVSSASIVDSIASFRDAIGALPLHPVCQDINPSDQLPKDAYVQFNNPVELSLRADKKKVHSCHNDQAIFLIARACDKMLQDYDSLLLDIPTQRVDISNTRKLAMFYLVMQQFLHDKEPSTKQTNRSYDKNLLIARVLYAIEWVYASYAVAYDDTKYTPNRKLYDLIKKYLKKPCEGLEFTSVYYQGIQL